MRNRESATQSRLRKKSYVKELEMRYRMLESHCSILQQTVAFTSQENILLKEELNKIKCSNLNGSKSGVVEPAALPSGKFTDMLTLIMVVEKVQLNACHCSTCSVLRPNHSQKIRIMRTPSPSKS